MKTAARPSLPLVVGILVSALLMVAWQAAAYQGVIGQLWSSPQRVLQAIVAMQVDGPGPSLLTHLLSTLLRTILASALGVSAGFGLGLLAAGRGAFLLALGAFIAAVPGLVWWKTLMAFTGYGDHAVILAGSIMAMIPMLTQTEKGVRSVPARIDWSARLMGADAATRRYEVLLLWALPSLLVGLRLSFTRAWRTVLVTEFFGGIAAGLGLALLQARELIRVDRVYAGLLLMGATFFAIERWGLRPLEREVARKWGQVRS